MVIQWKEKYPAFTGTEDRRVYVYLPLMYEYEPERRFPVLYMFDGHNVFYDYDATYGKSWGVGQYLDKHRIPLIVVAVECNHNKNHARLSEYTPYDFSEEGFGSITAYGKDTMDWFVKKLKRKIDRRYRTLRDREHTFIAGSSMGGLMSLYAVLEYNSTFSRCAALSPAIGMGGLYTKMLKLAKTAPLGSGTVVYADYGSNEIGTDMAVKFGKYVTELLQRDVFVTARIVPEGHHCEACWEQQLPFFIPALLYGIED